MMQEERTYKDSLRRNIIQLKGQAQEIVLAFG